MKTGTRFSSLIALSLVAFLIGCKDEGLTFPIVSDAKTRGLCGTCHMAYQPAMLPAASWRVMMGELDRHFDTKVVLKQAQSQHILAYLTENAADQALAGTPGKTAMQGLSPSARPQRIIDTPYWKQEHRFLENRVLDDWVGSPANCTACHVGAWLGNYKE